MPDGFPGSPPPCTPTPFWSPVVLSLHQCFKQTATAQGLMTAFLDFQCERHISVVIWWKLLQWCPHRHGQCQDSVRAEAVKHAERGKWVLEVGRSPAQCWTEWLPGQVQACRCWSTETGNQFYMCVDVWTCVDTCRYVDKCGCLDKCGYVWESVDWCR